MKKWASLTKKYLTAIVSLFCIIICSCELGLNEPEDIKAQVPVLTAISNDITTNQNKAVTLSVTAEVTDEGTLSYQWYSAADKLSDGTAIEQKNDFEFSPDVKNVGNTYYYCIITNTLKSDKKSITSPRILVTVIPSINAQAPVIATQPVNVSGELNQDFTFTVSAVSKDEGELTYQWYYSASKDGEYTPVQNATTQNLNSKISLTNLGYYYCIVTNTITDNGDGGVKTAVAITNKVILSNNVVNVNPPVIILQPKETSGTIGQDFTFSIIASSSDQGTLSYQWYYSADNSGNATAIQNATSVTYSAKISNTNAGYYYCVVTSTIEDNGDGGKKSACLQTQTVSLEKIIVNAAVPQISVQPTGTIAVIPAEHIFTVGASSVDGGIITYQWYSIEDTKNTASVIITNAVESNYSVSLSVAGKTGFYCVITNTITDNGDGGAKTASVVSDTAWFETVTREQVKPVITKQPVKMNVVIKNQVTELECIATIPNYSIPITYQWYECSDGGVDSITPIVDADKSKFTTPVFTERGIKYFYCVVSVQVPGNDATALNSIATVSDVVSVAYTGLPTVKVNTPGNAAITSKEDWLKNATISIEGAENDEWNFEPVKTSIRGRGNSSWIQPKKPYALKLDKKQQIMGMPKHKRWVLIANYLDNSFMRNEIAFYLSEQFGMDWTVHGEFVDLILNNEYKGLYWLGEAIKVDENRIDIDDGSETMLDDEDKDYLIEMDVYYDEPVKFKSSIRNMPYMIKNDDFMIDEENQLTTGGQARLNRLQEKITELEQLLYPNYSEVTNLNDCESPDDGFTNKIDLDSFAKFWLVNEIMSNGELNHPKSSYFTFDSTNNILKASAVWDFDYGARYLNSYCILDNSIYYNALFKSSAFRSVIKSIWSEKSINIDMDSRIESLKDKLEISANYDAKLWGVNHNPMDIDLNNFEEHVTYFKDIIFNKYSVVETAVNDL